MPIALPSRAPSPSRAAFARRRLVAALVVVPLALVTVACSGDDDEDGAGDASGSTTSTSAPGAEPECVDGALDDRAFIFCTAGDAPDQGLVVALHGRGSSAREMQAGTALDRAAAAQGLATVYPDAVDGGWGDDTFTTPTRPAGDEDVAFLNRLVDDLRASPLIDDDEPVGVVGFSNGASMALRYGAERPDEVRAVVAVAGQLPRDPAVHPSRPVPLLEVYGTADPVRSHDAGIPANPARQPGDPTPTLPTADTVAAFVATMDAPTHDGPEESDAVADDGTSLRSERWTGSDGTVVLLRAVVGGGHTWPSAVPGSDGGGGDGSVDFGPVSQDLDTSAEAIAFLIDPEGVELS